MDVFNKNQTLNLKVVGDHFDNSSNAECIKRSRRAFCSSFSFILISQVNNNARAPLALQRPFKK